MIEMKHLDIKFDNQIIFKNANFKTCPGKITGIFYVNYPHKMVKRPKSIIIFLKLVTM